MGDSTRGAGAPLCVVAGVGFIGEGDRKSSTGSSASGKVKSGARDTGSDLYSVGVNIAIGFANGVMSNPGNLIGAGAWLAIQVLSGAKNQAGVHSPSVVFNKELGVFLPLGVCAGIYSEQRALNRAGVGMVTGMLDAVKKTNIAEQGDQIGQDFSGSLTREISQIDLTPELRAMAKKFADTKLNLPVLNVEMRSAMESQLNRIATSKQGKIYQIVQSISNPEQNAGNTELFDYDRFERIQRRVAKEQSNRPIYLGTERIDKPLPEGAVPRI